MKTSLTAKKLFDIRVTVTREYAKKIDNLEKRLLSPDASTQDSFILGSDRAKLLEIRKLKKGLKAEINYLNSLVKH